MRNEKVLHNATITFLRRSDNILLARKTRKIGMGCLNGYGGGIEEGETEIESAIRELFKEAPVRALPGDLRKIAEAYFHNTKTDGTTFVCKCHVYELWDWQGKPRTTEEMANPRWFPLSNLPFKKMMLADPFWVPQIFTGEKFVVEACYGPFQKSLLAPVSIKKVKEF